MNKKKLIYISIAISIVLLWLITSLSPELAIRKHILFSLQPITSLKADITDMDRIDELYGHFYDVSGYKERATGGELSVFYLKKRGPLWYVDSVGTGP